MIDWLGERRRAGDAIAQHGFQHVHLRRGALQRPRLVPTRGGRAAEFVGLDGEETRRAVDAGWRVLKLAGVEPDGFVAPAYAYTPALRSVLPRKFRWWASLLRLHRTFAAPDGSSAQRLAPVWDVGTDGPLRRVLSPGLSAPEASCAARTCAWICIRPICSTRVTCWRSSGSSVAPGTGARRSRSRKSSRRGASRRPTRAARGRVENSSPQRRQRRRGPGVAWTNVRAVRKT